MSMNAVKKVEKELTKKEETQEEMAMVLAPRLNWVEQICPAPMAVNAMGQLALLSCYSPDFELKTPVDGWKFVMPSFKGSLMRVCNSGHNAFQSAHVNMDAIMQSTNRLPVDMKKAVEILVKGSNIHMEKFLPRTLQSIQTIADDCLDRAEEVEGKFILVQDMISELLEVAMVTQGASEDEKRDLKLQQEANEQEKTLYKERKENQKKAVDNLEKTVKKKTKEYETALNDIPTGWEVVGMTIVENLVGGITDTLKFVSGRGNPVSVAAGNTGVPQQMEQQVTQPQMSQGDLDLYRNLSKIQEGIIDLLDKLVVKNKETGEVEMNQDQKIFKDFESVHVKINIDRALPFATEETKRKVQPFVTKLKETLREKSLTKKQTALEALQTLAMVFEAEYQANSNKTLQPQSPHSSTAANQASGSGSASQTAVKNAQFKVEQSVQQLERAEARYDKADERLLATNNKLNEVIQELSKINARKMEVNEILKVLEKGLKILGELKERWSKLTIFFMEMSNLIKVSMNAPMKLFLGYAQDAKDVRSSGAPMDKLMRDLIYSTAREAVSYGYVVNRMSSGYHDISSQYLMEPVATLGRMMTLDKTKDEQEIRKLQNELNESSTNAQDAIIRMQKKEKTNFKDYMKKKMNAIESGFAELTEDLPASDKKAIKDAVVKGFAAAPEEEFDVGMDCEDW